MRSLTKSGGWFRISGGTKMHGWWLFFSLLQLMPPSSPPGARTSGTPQERAGLWCWDKTKDGHALLCFAKLPQHWTLTQATSPHSLLPEPPVSTPAQYETYLGKKMQKRPVESSKAGLKIEWIIYPCLPCKIHPNFSLCLCFSPPTTPAKPKPSWLSPIWASLRVPLYVCVIFFFPEWLVCAVISRCFGKWWVKQIYPSVKSKKCSLWAPGGCCLKSTTYQLSGGERIRW